MTVYDKVIRRASDQRVKILMDYGDPEQVEFEVTEEEFRALTTVPLYSQPVINWPRLMGMPLRLRLTDHPAGDAND